jgi:hypothetical protein
MALSSVFVVSNSLRLRRFRTAQPPHRPIHHGRPLPTATRTRPH